jgi:hypothetical protein
MREIFRTNNAISLDARMISANFTSCCMWMAYGFFGLNDVLVWGPNVVGLILTTIQIAVKLIYPSKDVVIISADMKDDLVKSVIVVGDKVPENDATTTFTSRHTMQLTSYAAVSSHL